VIWSWHTFWADFTDTGFLRAALTTVWLTGAAEGLGLVFGLVLAFGLLSRRIVVVAVTNVWVWVWRGTPLLVQLLVLYFGCPQFNIRLSVIDAGLVGLVCNESSYLAVLMKNSILGVPKGQIDAAKILGLTRGQRIRHIIGPQASRTFVPILGNQVNNMFKTTSLLSVIAVTELLEYTRSVVSATYEPFEAFAVATVYYLAICTLWNILQGIIERRQDPTRIRARRSLLEIVTGE
jgi:polar amino acid transport system permease protein